MAATTHGTAYLFGVSATSPTASVIQSITHGRSDSNVNMVDDESGKVVTIRSDAQVDTLELEVKLTASFTRPAIASKLTIVDSGTPSTAGEYMILNDSLVAQNKDFKTFRITAAKYEDLTLT